jgi:hypothetical protein
MPKRSSKKPEDPNETAFRVVQESIRDRESPVEAPKEKDPAAVALGRKGGLKGGKARAANLTKEQLSEIGKQGAARRWAPKDLP